MSDSGPVSRFAALRSERLGDDGGYARLYAAFLAARAALGLVLLLAQVGAWMAGGNRNPWGFWICLVYAALTLVHALVPRLRRAGGRRRMSGLRRPRWWASVGLDLAAFTTLQTLDAGGGVSLAALFILPVMMAGVLSSRHSALATAALATLGLLGALLPQGWDSAELSNRLTQAGLAGSGYFVVALLALELAARLAREQQAAKGSLAFARQQTALNQLVIDEMQEGVLVVDRGLKVRAANPAARALLGEREALLEPQFSLHDQRAWGQLVERVGDSFAARAAEPLDVTLNFAHAPARTLRVRSRVSRGREDRGSEDLCVLLLEDRATLLARVRRDKLAAMGRMSAGIAHEIRNPLAAISQANALLSEDLPDPGAQRLTGLVAANVKRLQRIVDEVMLLAASPGRGPPGAGCRESAGRGQPGMGGHTGSAPRGLPARGPAGLARSGSSSTPSICAACW